jgi:NitT/TauT family transport system substrate-binding protein
MTRSYIGIAVNDEEARMFAPRPIAQHLPDPYAAEPRMGTAIRYLATVMLCTLLLQSGEAAGQPLKIRIGWVVPTTDWALLMLEKRDLARHMGKSYELEPVRFASSPTVITAMANSELDIGNLAFSTLALAIENAGLKDLRVIADLIQDGVAGHFSNQFYVLRDGDIHRVEDLKGKAVASPGAGGAIDIAMRTMLLRHGLAEKRDYTVVEAPMPAMKAMLKDRKVDLAPGVPPFAFDPEFNQIGRVLFTQREALGPTQMIVLTARQGFLERNRAAVTDLLEDNLRIAAWYLDPRNQSEVVKIAARIAKQPEERFAGWLLTGRDYYRDPKMLPNIQVLQANIEQQRKLGFLKRAPDVSAHVDLSAVKEAAARLD